ncbi:hypothetical protein PVAND_009439 [Polypedilum vanderplanki]|uniref:Odorant receptor n=1 Tax=Polypedilum vanderplanki TaxID=319348 RepID=A0A9J6CD59_POLVA|nr:hypothetical protein PVAND_009439 [Polypedilum vanderplanki]
MEKSGDLKFDDFYKPTSNFFKVVGIDFDNEKPKSIKAKIKRNLITIYGYYGVFCLIMFSTNRAIQLPMIIVQGFEEIIKAMFSIIPLPVSAYQAIFFMTNKKEINKIVDMLKELFPKTQKDQEKYQIKIYHKSLVKFVKFYIAITSVLMFVFSLSTISKMIEDGIKVNEDTWLPEFLDRRNPYVFAVFSSCLFWITLGCVIPQIASNLIIGLFVSNLKIQFEILKVDIKAALNDPNLTLKEFKVLIVQHNKLIDISNRLRKLFSMILLLEFIQSSLVISCTTAQLLFMKGVDFIAFIVNFLFSFIHYYFPYYYGQLLYDSSQIVLHAIEESNWYNIKNNEVKKALILMTQSSRNAKYLTGSEFVIIYRPTYRKVLMTSYSFISLLLQLYEK